MKEPISIVECCDNIEFMKRFPDKFFDLANPDPNYGINAINMQMGSATNRKGKGQYPGESTAVKLKKGRLNQGSGKLKNRILNSSDINWDNSPPPAEYFQELFRVSKAQIIWGGNYFDLPPTRCIICWDKMQPWENFSQWEMAWTSFDKPAKMYRISNTGGANKEAKIHPTQKPIELYQRTFEDFCQPGFKILDPNMGSQGSRIVAYKMGFDYYGCDSDLKHFEDGCARFERECHGVIETSAGIKITQQTLF